MFYQKALLGQRVLHMVQPEEQLIAVLGYNDQDTTEPTGNNPHK